MKKTRTLIIFLICSIFSLSAFGQKSMPEMIFVEGGEFEMGSEKGDSDEVPVHTASVESFHISKTEITVGQYRAFCKATAWEMPPPPPWGWQDDNPMVLVSWKDAGAYTLWLSRETKKRYRLPTEKEWEYAAAGGKLSKSYKYSGSNTVDEVAWYYETTYGSAPQNVATKKPNELGIYDMSGNVWEWCKDGYTLQYYEKGTKNISKGPTGENYRVIRGGGWDSSAEHTRTANRDRNVPASSNESIGFRVVMEE